MTGKLMLHTALCAFVVFSLYLRLKDTTRRNAALAVMAGAALMALAPFIYRALPHGVFPRMTIHWAQIAFLAVSAYWFAPTPAGKPRYDAPWAPVEDEMILPLNDKKPDSVSLH